VVVVVVPVALVVVLTESVAVSTAVVLSTETVAVPTSTVKYKPARGPVRLAAETYLARSILNSGILSRGRWRGKVGWLLIE
jgi:hypothetical protein